MFAVVTGAMIGSPEVKNSKSGTQYVSFAINDRTDSKHPVFVNCRVFGKSMDYVLRFLQTGQVVTVMGNLEAEAYSANGGEPRVRLSMIPDRISGVWGKNTEQQNATEDSFENEVMIPF